MTPNQLNRISSDLSHMAQEKISLEKINSSIYAYGSELACLRLGQKYVDNVAKGSAKVAYSENLKTWFFRLDVSY